MRRQKLKELLDLLTTTAFPFPWHVALLFRGKAPSMVGLFPKEENSLEFCCFARFRIEGPREGGRGKAVTFIVPFSFKPSRERKGKRGGGTAEPISSLVKKHPRIALRRVLFPAVVQKSTLFILQKREKRNCLPFPDEIYLLKIVFTCRIPHLSPGKWPVERERGWSSPWLVCCFDRKWNGWRDITLAPLPLSL